jgi:iron complex outermembrane receptor protein
MGVTTYQGYIFAERAFHTGAIQHTFKIGFTDDRSETKYAYPYVNKNVSVGKAGAYSIYRANHYADDPATTTQGAPSKTTDITTLPNLIISDQIRLARQWALFAGVTRAAIDAQDWDYSSYVTKGTVTKKPENDKSNFTPGVALSYKPVSSITGYASYMEGLQAGPTVGSTYANANEILSPYLSSQYELGVKTKFSNMTANVAVFHISTANTYANPDTNVLTEDGREIHKGIEFTSSAHVANSLSLTGGFTLLNAAVTKTSTAATLHKTPVGVPKQIARLAGEYQLPWLPHLALTGGYSFTSKTWYDSANKLVVPSYMTGDAGARYGRRFGKKQMLIFRLNVTNLTNNNYWGNSGSLSLGTPRTYACSTEYLF